ncbi:MAG: class I SAM-dependent methyltransferase, partial [Kangiellaceae bacterium]|nr:class I SAM-dependent methyltransferase [Kangiellaceae bacterium]
TAEVRALPRGTLAKLVLPAGRQYGLVHANPHSLITARLLTRNLETAIDAGFFERRLERALHLREKLLPGGHYRLVHGEGDGVPGLVVDRYGDAVVVQPNSAGMAAVVDAVIAAVQRTLAPKAIVVRGDSQARKLEGLAVEAPRVVGDIESPVPVHEGGRVFYADLLAGQKTGWFFDQRANREWLARQATGGRMLDLYSYSGGFAGHALAAGAAYAEAVDRSSEALALAQRAVDEAGHGARFATTTGDVFNVLGDLVEAKRRFEVVVCDPPPFAPSKKDVPAALRGYRKLARGAAAVTAAEGFLAVASCSHNVTSDALLQATFEGVRDAGRQGRLIFSGGAGPDHPLHPALAESRYLSFLVFALD